MQKELWQAPELTELDLTETSFSNNSSGSDGLAAGAGS